jgi:UTP:GlnB (protein PII) uridylyltransferase
MDSNDVIATAHAFPEAQIVAVHNEGWEHFRETAADLQQSFAALGIAKNLWLIDEEFRQNPRHHRLFLEILRAPRGVTHELRRMNNYGVLGRYIPAFGRVVGRMQYDLFHAYTVDAHTLAVLRNMQGFSDGANRDARGEEAARHPRVSTF